jgi:hypothetical protein
MRTVLSTPARRFPDFPAALSLVALLGPDDACTQLEARAGALEMHLADLEKPVPSLPRLFLLEAEYMAAVVRAEIQWLRAVTSDLRSGRLTWSEEWLRRMAAKWASQAGSASRPESARAVSPAPDSDARSMGDKRRDQPKRVTMPSRRQGKTRPIG